MFFLELEEEFINLVCFINFIIPLQERVNAPQKRYF